MKVLLAAINASWTHSCPALYYLRNMLPQGYQAQIAEFTLKQPVSETAAEIFSRNPQVLCLSIYIWNALYLRQLLPLLRQGLPEAKIVIGGPEVSFDEEAPAKYNPDYLVRGYGEMAFRRLAESMFILPDKVLPEIPLPLADIPFPYRDEDIALLQGKIVYYESSRGCACRCIYCLSGREEKCCFLPLERVYSDIPKLLKMQPKVIKFVDRSFNQDKQRARAIWQFVIALETEVPFHFEVHPDWLEQEDFTLLANASPGRLQFETGIQSIHPRTLRTIGRFSDWQKAKHNLIRLRQETHVSIHSDLLAGLPGERLDEVLTSLREALQTNPQEIQLGLLKILWGTPMRELAAKLGYTWDTNPPYQVRSTPELSLGEMTYLQKLAAVLNFYWNSGYFPTFWQEILLTGKELSILDNLLLTHLHSHADFYGISRESRFCLLWDVIAGLPKRLFYRDILLWDWCQTARERHLPDFMKDDYTAEFIHSRKDELEKATGMPLSVILRRYLLFVPLTDKFKDKYLKGKEYRLFHIKRKEPAQSPAS